MIEENYGFWFYRLLEHEYPDGWYYVILDDASLGTILLESTEWYATEEEAREAAIAYIRTLDIWGYKPDWRKAS